MQNQSRRLPPLDLLVSFEAAARQLSFTRAGAERFITQSAMSRQIAALEEDLGVSLFRRRHRALELTPEGEQLQAVCSEMLAQLRAVIAQIRAPTAREELSLTTTPGLASLWLIPRLALFTKDHPAIDVRLDASLPLHELGGGGFDLAIRYGRVGQTEGELLFGEVMLPVCSPQLLRGGPALRSAADLRLHTLLQMQWERHRPAMPLEWELWLRSQGQAGLQPAATLSFSGYGETITAALAGQGVALGRRPLVDALLQSGQLVAPFADDGLASMRAFHLVLAPEAAARPAVLALAQWLRAQAALTAAASG
ncbi:MAG: LysR family transcriptional regulator [Burkholderiaceae bacterium]|nr:LysR family transcriptional regulator [Burkholderiaceae bacterium]